MFEDKLHFSQEDMQVFYFNEKAMPTRHKNADFSYFMIIMLKGSSYLRSKTELYRTKPHDVLIANKSEDFYIEFDDSKTEYLEIYFSSKLIHMLDNCFDLLKPFYDKRGFKIYNNYLDKSNFECGVNNMIAALKTHSSRIFILSALLHLLIEVDKAYETNYSSEIKETDSNFAKIVNYIDNHIFEKLTLEKISENVFLSKHCICDTFNRVSSMSYRQYVLQQKASQAQKLIGGSDSMKVIANKCGFDTYSTFYRSYKEYFGITPSEERARLKKERKNG